MVIINFKYIFTPDFYIAAYPLLLYVLGIVLYSIFIWYFYRSLGKRDLISLDLHKYNTSTHPIVKKILSVLIYIFEYIIFFPLLTFIWFSVLSFFLLLLSKNQTLDQILLLSMALVASARICSYFKEDLARDLSKIIPFTLLGIFLIDASLISSFSFIDKFAEIPIFLKDVLNYFVLVIMLEFVIRIPYSIYSLLTKEEIGEEE